ncbi:bifunctional diaminohydroxyphosphoribosylaminopyrimidine deaminase/5-amino-6-(5-phosphoribosylamino)uracil reductase RibD [Sphingobacterium sp. xlx-130]|uniref:bifunctional diaminohydroxyphosphoribosylaminopyrimidine deaminase/5-amino-6-(5-phosphoribosylamino)uracil reductase RibD n=1 Tax=Sphingobacterium sp. xlx-130 TaxID=2654323 RepID=UPI0013D9B5E3|nr:bifunctional diaminohydroxyphosphoribosylaminopyrimidine deaminase/5-amino-6-(5-phosphoribosylamino)uracil reductase RibD [Sphingobacterium sp. xlx-130]
MTEDQRFMSRCIALAQLGAGTTSPNPMVGAVIVYEGKILGEGYTSPYGGAHAEVNAVEAVKTNYGDGQANELLKQSTVYVSLEPCAHYGKTPPCADMLVRHGVRRVVVGCEDPFAKVNGLGIAKLRDAGIDVEVGVLEEECRFVNRRFFTRIGQHRPYVILKWAETKDGYFAPIGDRQAWISNRASRQLSHKWRSEEDAIMVGAATALIDDPMLNNRLWSGKSPKRVLIDRNLAVPKTARLLMDDSTDLIIFNEEKAAWDGHLKYIALENYDLYLPHNILYQLYLMDVQSLIIEGGGKTLNRFIEAGLWDEARVFVGECVWGEGIAAPRMEGAVGEEIAVASDRLKLYYKASS